MQGAFVVAQPQPVCPWASGDLTFTIHHMELCSSGHVTIIFTIHNMEVDLSGRGIAVKVKGQGNYHPGAIQIPFLIQFVTIAWGCFFSRVSPLVAPLHVA